MNISRDLTPQKLKHEYQDEFNEIKESTIKNIILPNYKIGVTIDPYTNLPLRQKRFVPYGIRKRRSTKQS